MMELHHRSCVLPSNAPALPEPDTFIPSRVLQERSANRRHEYSGTSLRKRSPSPTENVYSSQLGSYFTGNLGSHYNGDKSEAQIDIETRRLMKLLKNCDRYQKYREGQPSETPLRKASKEQRWPDHLEEAFFRALVRWPPMGRRKLILDGHPRGLGRNELIAYSIKRDTGEPRTRKQVSSHIQVLKPMLADQPQILVYMSNEDMGGRSGRGRQASSHLHRHRHTSHTKYDYLRTASDSHQGFGHLPSSLALARLQSGHEESPYTVANFDMFVEVGKRHAHDFTQLSGNSRLGDLHVTDTTPWHKQYPEFKFLRMEELRDHPVLICDAAIKVMTTERPAGATLSIIFDLRSRIDLSMYDSLECLTRFFENGKVADQPDGDWAQERKTKQSLTQGEYYADHGLMRVHFGSKFWAHQMQKLGDKLAKAAAQEDQPTRSRYEELVRRELQHMTATQDIYGVKDGEQTRLLTILWRFSQTRTSREVGRMTWRVAHFGYGREKGWAKEEELERIRNAKELVPPSSSSLNALLASQPYPSLPLDFQLPLPPPLDLDALALESIAPSDFSSASAPSLETDYSQPHSLPSLSHSQDTHLSQSHSQDAYDAVSNDFDFNGGHITIAGCLEPAINAYDAYDAYAAPQFTSHLQLPNLSAMTEMDGAQFSDLVGMQGSGVCYATKPSWHHPSLISHLESAAETYGVGDLMGGANDAHGGVEGMMGDGGLWKLQAAFGGEDTGVGAEGRRDSKVGEAEFEERGGWRV